MAPPVPTAQIDEAILPWARAWQGLKGKRVLLTGGTGTVGSWLLELYCRANALWDLGSRIQVLSRDPEAFHAKCPHLAADPAVTFLRGDIRTFGPSAGPFGPSAGPFDLVIHGANDASGAASYTDLLGHLDTLVLGTRHLLERALEAKAQRVLLLSSGAVYGPQPPDLERIPETHPGAPDPMNPGTRYAQGKRMSEHLCMVFRHQFGLDAVIARGFALVGPHLPLDTHLALGNFIRDALAGRPVEVLGDGTPWRSYLYASEYAMACWLILLSGQPGRAYNVGSPEGIRLGDLARMVAGMRGLPVVIRQEAREGVPAERYLPSVRRMEEELGFRSRIDLINSIRRTMDWYKM